MRHKLIEWLIDDVAPRVRRSGDAEGELLKFANEQNLSPALLEGLGQLFNTAKTISYMDKSANRGGTFPTVDVQRIVSQYLEVPASKMAADQDGWLQTDKEMAPRTKMPNFFDMPETGDTGLDFTVDAVKSASTRRESLGPLRANIATTEMVKTDFEEDARTLLNRLVKSARRGNLNWELLEGDSLALFGDDVKPAIENAVSYLKANNITVKRASYDGKPRFVESPAVVEIEFLMRSLDNIKAANEMLSELQGELKSATQTLVAPEKPEATSAAQDMANALVANQEKSSPKAPAPQSGKGGGLSTPGGSLRDSLPSAGDSSKSILKTGPDAIFDLLRPARDHFMKSVARHVSTPHDDSGEINGAMDDAHHLALLQNLMTTDDVLSEADPDQVVSAFNTIRSTAPQLAKDINVMRVALRSAVQHEGIDPFTVKGLAETETARAKVHAPSKPKQAPEKE